MEWILDTISLGTQLQPGQREDGHILIPEKWLEQDGAWKALTPLVDAWLDAEPLKRPKVTAANRFTRRPAVISQAVRAAWRDERPLAAVEVDGEPMAARLRDIELKAAQPWPHERLHKRQAQERKMRLLSPDQQMKMKLPWMPAFPRDMRLAVLEGLHPALANDVHAMMVLAHALNPPGIELSPHEGAKLLARSLDGGFRHPKPKDVERFLDAALYLRLATIFYLDNQNLSMWREMADVKNLPNGNIVIGPPPWMRGGRGDQWRLTAEGGVAAKARVTAGKGGAAGRMVTGIEHRLTARWDGRPGIAPDVRSKPGDAGDTVFVPWHEALHHRGDAWDRTDAKEEKAAAERYRATMERIRAAGYFSPSPNPRDTAPAGDAIEIVSLVRGGRGREAGMRVRASARFTEAARLANKAEGRGFNTMTMEDWMGYEGQILDRKPAEKGDS